MPTSQVIIVGAGPAGLMSALLLARYGVTVTLIERHPGTSIHPKARGLNVRTMEILRSLGLEGAVKQAGKALEKNRFMLFVESLAGEETRRIADDDLMMKGEALAEYTPCTWTQCAQDELEKLLLAEAVKAGAEIRFHAEVEKLTQDNDGVRVSVRDLKSGGRELLEAEYVLACDGSNSPTRAALGIELQGRSAIEHFVNIYFRCDLRKYAEGRWFGICFVENPKVNGLFLPVDNDRRWLFNVQYDPAKESPESFTNERCRELLKAAIGEQHPELEIIAALPWAASAQVAPTLRGGRVFLLGDAGHIMPPAGGFGLNMAVQDAHNLSWKLAYVLKARAGAELLESYEQERLPLAKSVVEYAEREMDAPNPWEHAQEGAEELRGPGGPPQEGEGGGNPWEQSLEDKLKAVIGFQYRSSAVVGEDEMQGLSLRAQPGTRFPHAFMEDGSSTLDLLPTTYVIITTDSTPHPPQRPPLPTVELPRVLWSRLVKPEVEAVLVRPDNVVAAAGSWMDIERAVSAILPLERQRA